MKRETMPSCRIAYLRRTGPYGSENGALMKRLTQLAEQAGLLDENATILGIAWDDPTLTPPAACRYDACLVLAEDAALPGTAVQYARLAGGAYAVLSLPHTAQALTEAWASIGRTALQNGFTVDGSRPIVERYRAAGCALCIPCSD